MKDEVKLGFIKLTDCVPTIMAKEHAAYYELRGRIIGLLEERGGEHRRALERPERAAGQEAADPAKNEAHAGAGG